MVPSKFRLYSCDDISYPWTLGISQPTLNMPLLAAFRPRARKGALARCKNKLPPTFSGRNAGMKSVQISICSATRIRLRRWRSLWYCQLDSRRTGQQDCLMHASNLTTWNIMLMYNVLFCSLLVNQKHPLLSLFEEKHGPTTACIYVA